MCGDVCFSVNERTLRPSKSAWRHRVLPGFLNVFVCSVIEQPVAGRPSARALQFCVLSVRPSVSVVDTSIIYQARARSLRIVLLGRQDAVRMCADRLFYVLPWIPKSRRLTRVAADAAEVVPRAGRCFVHLCTTLLIIAIVTGGCDELHAVGSVTLYQSS